MKILAGEAFLRIQPTIFHQNSVIFVNGLMLLSGTVNTCRCRGQETELRQEPGGRVGSRAGRQSNCITNRSKS